MTPPTYLGVRDWLAERAGIIADAELTPKSPAWVDAGVEALDQLAEIMVAWSGTYRSRAALSCAQAIQDARTTRGKLEAIERMARLRDTVEAL